MNEDGSECKGKRNGDLALVKDHDATSGVACA